MQKFGRKYLPIKNIDFIMENIRNLGLKKNPYNQTKKKWWINE